jgi:hypothetical protein
MTRSEYNHARETLNWSNEKIAQVIGVSRRSPFRYAAGGTIPKPQAHLLRLLVLMRLTMSERKFEEIVKQLH